MPQKLFVPSLGTSIVLTEDWTFPLYFESRNSGLLQKLCDFEPLPKANNESDFWYKWRVKNHGKHLADWEGSSRVLYEKAMTEDQLKDAYKTYYATNSSDNPYVLVTLPAGTVLEFDRIYIRKGVEAFNSVTFRIPKSNPDKKFRSCRFWAKLKDVNKLMYELII